MLVSGGSPYKDKTVSFLPAFLISQEKPLRRAAFLDSFPPGEAKPPAAARRYLLHKNGENYEILPPYLAGMPIVSSEYL